ncbi:MAG: DUF2330 domain-containing protein [Myxococcales bacterium]|nr:DUF2330 domain-containing protein [Myxococcales bacterium]
MRSWARVGMGLMVLAAATGSPSQAEACGGTFCDQAPPGQQPMPVDQTGENVLFVMKNGTVEAHIQIQYQGDPARFAWVIPLPAKPTLSVGSQVLFTNLLNGSVPSFRTTTSFQFCGEGDDTTSSSGCGMSSADSGGSSYGPGAGGAGGGNSNSPQVISREAVGNFQTLTLEPKDAKGMLDWLVANGYDADQADAEPILKDYIDRGYLFVALKLEPGAGVDEIHPLVVSYQGTEPCVPLKLTRIAAVEDMTVRTFFLGDQRVVPTGGYKHVEMNGARLDWTQLGQNYNLAIARAVDGPAANGRAFLTEYAGPSTVVSQTGIWQSSWSGDALKILEPQAAVARLQAWNLLACFSSSSCTSPHPLVFPLLDKYLPPPAGVSPEEYYSCMGCHPEADLSAWNPDAFGAEFDELIATPAKHAVEVLGDSVYLTRMVTRISPAEMTEDPMFREWPEPLPDVSNQLSATRTTRCDGSLLTTTSDGRAVAGTTAPGDLPTDLPWASLVEEYTLGGDHLVLLDNDEKIATALEAYNEKVAPGSTPTATDASGLGNETNGSCGCSLPSRRSSPALLLGLLGVLGLARRAGRAKRA